MASIFRRSYWKTVNGQRVKRETSTYYIKYIGADGKPKRVKGFKNKAKTQTLASKLEADAADGPNPYDRHRRTALTVHLDAYKQHLNAKNDDQEHVRQTFAAIGKVLHGCEFKVFDDVQVSAVENWIAKKRERPNFGIRTANYHTKAVKAFLTWMVKNGRAPSNPLAHMADLNGKVDVRRERRSLPQDDFCRLVEAARKGKVFRRLSGPDRAMLYEAAAYTGLREGELASLSRASFNLDANPPTVTVEADKSKHRAKDILPIHAELAARLRDWMPAEGKLWPGSWHQRGSEMVQADLKAARKTWIEEVKPEDRPERERSPRFSYRDEQGRYFDFHALRGQFVSSLARAGVHPKVAQQLARHSTIHLTMANSNYTHLDRADLAGALESLPTLNRVLPAPSPAPAPDQSVASAKQASPASNGSPKIGTTADPITDAEADPKDPGNGRETSTEIDPKTTPKIGTKIGTSADDVGGQNPSLPVTMGDLMGEWAKSGQETPNPLQNKGFSNACHQFSERRARDSNPQPVSRHLISSQAASHSLTLRIGSTPNLLLERSSGKNGCGRLRRQVALYRSFGGC